jgi:hypothetical protein
VIVFGRCSLCLEKPYNYYVSYYFGCGVLVVHSKSCLLLVAVFLVVFAFFGSLGFVQAQDVTYFTPQDVFEIPVVNGSIRFSVNGTYTAAVLENDTWVFNGLTLSGSRDGNLTFSAKNCNVVIHSFRSSSLRYTVEGVGEQVMNFGFNSSRPSHVSEWSVRNQDSVFFAEGKNWQLLPDDTVVVCGLLGTLTVMRYNYGYPVVDDRPFYLQHSAIILTGVAVVVTVTAASIIKLKTMRSP